MNKIYENGKGDISTTRTMLGMVRLFIALKIRRAGGIFTYTHIYPNLIFYIHSHIPKPERLIHVCMVLQLANNKEKLTAP